MCSSASCLSLVFWVFAHLAGWQEIKVDGENVVPGVWEVLDKIRAFSDGVRAGKWVSLDDHSCITLTETQQPT